MIRLLFTSSRTPFDAVIRAFEGGTCSHVGIEIGDDLVIDTTFLQGGVAEHSLDEFMQGRKLIHAIELQLPNEAAALAFLVDQLGKPYDWTALAGFMFWRDWSETDAWYCSELAAAFLKVGGWALADRHVRVGVRLLLEIAFARACSFLDLKGADDLIAA